MCSRYQIDGRVSNTLALVQVRLMVMVQYRMPYGTMSIYGSDGAKPCALKAMQMCGISGACCD